MFKNRVNTRQELLEIDNIKTMYMFFLSIDSSIESTINYVDMTQRIEHFVYIFQQFKHLVQSYQIHLQ